MILSPPYLLFIGDATDLLSIKMARGLADWRPELCVGEYRLDGCTVSTGLAHIEIEQAVKQGAKTLVLGLANSGGIIKEAWLPAIMQALDAGMDIVSGMHDKLSDISSIKQRADKNGCQLHDIRHPTAKFVTGTGEKRSGKRILTVGTDCSVGKMYTSLALEKAMDKAGFNVDFRATGQSGILIAGQGVAIDCVVSDFIAGATESLSPNNEAEHWDIIEGQGSLSHPAFAGVSLGLLHGSQPDYLVVCHALNRVSMRGLPHCSQPSIADTISLNIQAAKLTNKKVQLLGIAVNTSVVDTEEAKQICDKLESEFGVPVFDPLRDGCERVVQSLVSESHQ
ncbi:DUF1611 domain-containing protein [Pseudoalteromonas phenolica]|uniref:DUF1611 domain-containing protein n=1 Tax=Pseudoalteromonas phenolica TaxID=161398 RepID=A0A4Q7IRZ7_9GAMM|nr:N-acetyltransferase DgcN [Pseudoalteromonas phenolica]RZQ54389.1 DUF1611 domain-containing protein [Pseudoalteromonas phenolica]